MITFIIIFLGVIAPLLHITAYVTYNMQAKEGSSKPNIVSWSIWFFLSGINAFSYLRMSDDLVKALLPISGSLMCMITFIHVLLQGKFSKPGVREVLVFIIGIVAVVMWKKFESAAFANLIIQGALVISFYPTIRGVLRDPLKENSTAWIIWSCGFATSFLVVLFRFKQTEDLISPLVLFFAHSMVAVLCRDERKEAYINWKKARLIL